VPDSVRGGSQPTGGIAGYPLEKLYEEVAYLAYHFHWPPEYLLELDHFERHRWVEQVAAINRKLNDAAKGNR
jgi:hypothetical protein